jgi:hypothetical protein
VSDRRAAIRQEIEETRRGFHELVASVGEAGWRRPSAVPGWSVGAVLVHVVLYPESVVPRGVRAARLGKAVGGFPPFLVRVGFADWANKWGMRLMAGRESAASVRARYDRAHERLLALLDQIGDDEWGRATYTLGETMTIEQLFRVHPRHFREHKKEIAHG